MKSVLEGGHKQVQGGHREQSRPPTSLPWIGLKASETEEIERDGDDEMKKGKAEGDNDKSRREQASGFKMWERGGPHKSWRRWMDHIHMGACAVGDRENALLLNLHLYTACEWVPLLLAMRGRNAEIRATQLHTDHAQFQMGI